MLICTDELYKETQESKELFFKTIDSLHITSKDKEILKNIFAQSEVFTDVKKNIIRKRILDNGNDLARNLEKEFERFEVSIKQ